MRILFSRYMTSLILVALLLAMAETAATDESPTVPPASTIAEGAVDEAESEPVRASQPIWMPPAGLDATAVIDLLIEQGWHDRDVEPSSRCDDRTFARRVYLDLIGRIPTRGEVDQFLSNTNSDKRDRLIDALLDHPEYGRHMGEVFDAVLMGRRGVERMRERQKHGWLEYISRSFQENRPWNQITREILLARPTGEEDRGAQWFVYERRDKHQDIAEAISPSFFGVQIQCAQCHDHPLAAEIEQAHYWGLVAFYNRGKNVGTPNGPRVSESAVGGFAKFTDLTGTANDAELTFLGAATTVPEQRPTDEAMSKDLPEKYIHTDEQGNQIQPPLPRFSRREKFVDQIVRGNPLVARAMVNRTWALLLGRGIVHPVDKMNSLYEPTHPELLDWLARGFESHNYDVKRLVRTIVRSRVYQLEAVPTGDGTTVDAFAWSLQKPLSAESYFRSMLIATDGTLSHDNDVARFEFSRLFPEVFPEESVSTLKQSLFLSNNEAMHQVVTTRPGGILEELRAVDDDDEVVKQIFAVVFCREATAAELSACSTYLSARADRRQQAIEQLMWALVTSPEFRFNH